MIESAFNRLLRFDSSGPITRRDESDSKSRSEFESNDEIGPKIVEFDRKLIEFYRKTSKSRQIRQIRLKFDQNSINFRYKSTVSTIFGPNLSLDSNSDQDFESDSLRRVIGPLESSRKFDLNQFEFE